MKRFGLLIASAFLLAALFCAGGCSSGISTKSLSSGASSQDATSTAASSSGQDTQAGASTDAPAQSAAPAVGAKKGASTPAKSATSSTSTKKSSSQTTTTKKTAPKTSSKKSESTTSKSSSSSSGSSSSSSSSSSSPKPESKITVTVTVDCKTAVDGGFKAALALTSSGTLSHKTVTLPKWASAYDALKATGLSVGSESTAMGRYVYAISSLKEKACGDKSGWLYSVNGTFISRSSDSTTLHSGDSVRWRYTCDGGKDI